MRMRLLTAGLLLTLATKASAQGADPIIDPDVDPATLIWYYGCLQGFPDLCARAAIGRGVTTGVWSLYWPPFLAPGWALDDIWGAGNDAGTCVGGGDILQWRDGDCLTTEAASISWGVRVDNLAAPAPDLQSAYLMVTSVTSTPEPATALLIASGLAGLGAVLRRRRRS